MWYSGNRRKETVGREYWEWKELEVGEGKGQGKER